MKDKKLVLAYCQANQNTAAKIESDLAKTGYQFEHITEPAEGNIGNQLVDISKPILLLVSDNLLKTTSCMDRSMLWFQKVINSGKILPIIIDGEYPNEHGDLEHSPTVFDKVSNVIKYMNHWQEEYLELRREKRYAHKADIPALEDKLRIVKGISSEIGEFLRYLKGVPYYYFEDFAENAYKAFFHYIGDTQSHIIPKEKEVVSEKNDPILEDATQFPLISEEDQTSHQTTGNKEIDDSTQSLVEMIQASSKDIINENISERGNKEAEETEEDVDLSGIPGLDLLKKSMQNGNDQEDSNDLQRVLQDMDNGQQDTSSLVSLIDTIVEEDKNPSMEDGSVDDIIDKVLEETNQEDGIFETEKMADLASVIDLSEEDSIVIEDIEEPTIEIIKEKTPIIVESSIVESLKVEIQNTEERDAELKELFNEVDVPEKEDILVIEDAPKIEMIPSEIQEHSEQKNIVQEITEENILKDMEIEDLEEEFEEDEDLEEELGVVDAYISQAYKRFESEEWEEGFETLESAIEQYPTDSDLRYQYALALARYRHDFRGASRQLEILLGHDQQHEDAYFLLAELAEMHKDPLTARNYYEKVAAINPDYPEIFYRLGILTMHHFPNQKKTAASHFKAASKQNKRNADAIYRLGILMNEHFEKHWKAVKYFKKVLKIQPEHPFANYDLAILYHRLGDRALANIYYQKATEINPELKTVKNDEAFKYELIGDAEESILPPFGEAEEDPEFAELKRDMERLEKKMNELNDEPPINVEITQEPEAVSLVLPEEKEVPAPPKIEPQTNLIAGFVKETRDTPVQKPTEAPVIPAKPLAKVVLITGATSGIGRATAEIFAKHGFRIIMTGRRIERLENLKKEFEAQYANDIQVLPFDVRDVKATETALNSLDESWKFIDILINNAGLAKGFAPIHEGNLDHWETMIDTNIKGLLYMTRAISPHMVARGSGHIINIASIAGKEVYPNGNVYCATKFAVDALTRGMRLDLVKHNIRVSQVAPAHVEETEFAVVRFDGDKERAKIYEDFKPLTAHDVAETIYFIASQPKHVNILDVVIGGTQQASATIVDRSGR